MRLIPHKTCWTALAGILFLSPVLLRSQHPWDSRSFYSPDAAQRTFDSLVASRIPVFPVPADALIRPLPDSLDNSRYIWFPGILDQDGYFSCQQYCAAAYTFAYEINRLRNADGKLPENKYPPHYTWHFFNEGEQYVGVNFLHSFHAMREQGHMTNADFGPDNAQQERGWINGYDKYYRAMQNRLREVYAIPVNSIQGILTVKQYLYDHLDGSATGGIVCFTASSPSHVGGGLKPLPPGTPEAGKDVLVNWLPYPTHGMTLVGYHDSIRYDLNEDGQYTNDLDITGDGVVDARDWEIGGFRVANSYGTWWSDQGYFYVLYHAMASGFEEGGVWNNRVYVAKPDPGYSPLLTLKIHLEHNQRNLLKILAGVSRDLQAEFPDHILEPPLFHHQGGPYYMQGFDSLPEQKNLDFGLDVTPLLSFVEPGEPAKFFLVVEERDPGHTGQGTIHEASFVHYGGQISTFPCEPAEIPIHHNATTTLSAMASISFPRPEIVTQELPPLPSSGNCTVQLEAQGGEPPYTWSLDKPYYRRASTTLYESFTDQPLYPQTSGKPHARVPLPFSFPFFDQWVDTVYVNAYGMIHFTPEHLPYPYLCSVTDMFRYTAAIVPSFSRSWVIRQQDGDGMWMRSTPDSVIFRWKLSLQGVEQQTNAEFLVILYPNGSVTACFGPIQILTYDLITWTGISMGDHANVQVDPVFDLEAEAGRSYTWSPAEEPVSVSITPGGLFSIWGADTSRIHTLLVRVTDARDVSTEKAFQLSDGLLIRQELSSNSGLFQYQEPASLDLRLTNIGTGPLTNLDLQFFCSDPRIHVSDSLTTVPLLESGQTTGIDQAFTFQLESIVPDQTVFPYRIVAATPDKIWESTMVLTVSAPDVQVTGYAVEDGVNGLLDVGETADLVVRLSNLGSLATGNLTCSLSTADSLLEILSSPVLLPESLGRKASCNLYYHLRASRFTPPGHLASLLLQISNGSTIELHYPIILRLGIHPIALIQLAASTTSTGVMTACLDSLQAGYDLHTSMPVDDLNLYPCIFLILGTTYPGSATLTTEETYLLRSYLENGGYAYLESYASWFYGTNEILEGLFKFSTEQVPVYSFNQVKGIPGTFAEGMDFLYLGSTPYAIFEVTPEEEGFSLMTNGGNPAKCVKFAYNGTDYKTIGTFTELGKLVDTLPPSRRNILFRKYLDFFEVNLTGPFPFFHADITHICRWHRVHFTDDSFDSIISWNWEFPGGDPAWSQEQHPVVTYHHSGTFDVILTVSDGEHARTMHKKDYIHVQTCAGEDEPLAAEGKEIRIYPNPARELVWVELSALYRDQVSLTLYDLRGTAVKRWIFPPGSGGFRVSLDVSGLPGGFYIVRVVSDHRQATGKLVVH